MHGIPREDMSLLPGPDTAEAVPPLTNHAVFLCSCARLQALHTLICCLPLYTTPAADRPSLASLLEPQGFPTLMFFPAEKDATPIPYEGGRTLGVSAGPVLYWYSSGCCAVGWGGMWGRPIPCEIDCALGAMGCCCGASSVAARVVLWR